MAHPDTQPLSPRKQFLLFLRGAFAAKHGGYHAPVAAESRRHFLDGMSAVDAGHIVVGDAAVALDFIERVERGVRPVPSGAST